MAKPNRLSVAPFVLLVTGSRDLPDPSIVGPAITEMILDVPLTVSRLIIRHGDCPGENSADQAATAWAERNATTFGVELQCRPAKWDLCAADCSSTHRRVKKRGDIFHPGEKDTYCPAAGPRRNGEMIAEDPRPNRVLAFPTGQSYGTYNCMTQAKHAGIPVRVIVSKLEAGEW